MPRKDVYSYECMNGWETFNETLVNETLLEDITYFDYIHAKRVCKDFEIKYLGEYHYFYLKIDTLFLADVF